MIQNPPRSAAQNALHPASLWGIAGVCLLLCNAIVRLFPKAWSLVSTELSVLQLCILGFTLVFFFYTEGVKGFHQRFNPRVVQRLLHLSAHGTLLEKLLAPAYAMTLFRGTRRRVIASWCLIVGITILVIAIKYVPTPWREIVDAGVVVGLSTGVTSLLWWYARALAGREPGVDPSLPQSVQAASMTMSQT